MGGTRAYTKGKGHNEGFFAIVIYKGIYRVPWNLILGGSFNLGCDFVSRILPQRVFWMIFRHIRFGPVSGVPKSGEPGYHPYQALLPTINMLRKFSQQLWTPGGGNNTQNARYVFQYDVLEKGRVMTQK